MKCTNSAKHHKRGLKLLPAACAVLLWNTVLAQPEADAYRVMAVTDQAHGDVLLAGNYEDAIAKLEAQNRRASRFAASNNLCVAYTVKKNVVKMKAACETAVKLSRARTRDRAVAFSNRGVLMALTGDLAAAREDFSASIRIRARLRQPVYNLARLESKAEPVASL